MQRQKASSIGIFMGYFKYWLLLSQVLLIILNPVLPAEEESSVGKSLPNNVSNAERVEFDASTCGHSKGCLFKPPNCTPHKDCIYGMSYAADQERIYFELLGQVQAERNVYVALGFSVDGLMGGDTVTDCSSFEGSPFRARLSYNPGKSNRKVPLEANREAEILRTDAARNADGTLYCRFSQLIQPPSMVQSQFVRPLSTPIYVLMSSGETRNQELSIHSLNADSVFFPYSSPSTVDFLHYRVASGWSSSNGTTEQPEPSNSSGAVETTKSDVMQEENSSCGDAGGNSASADVDAGSTTKKAHGVLMLLAWLLLAPFAILTARFLHRESLELFGLHIWFQIHRMANCLAFVLVLIAFICIFAYLDGAWLGPRLGNSIDDNLTAKSMHALFGIVTVVLTIVQPLIALFRCSPASPARFIFNWAHAVLGYWAWFCAAVSISIACLMNVKFSDNFLARDLLIASLALVMVSFSVLQWFSFRRRRQVMDQMKGIEQQNGISTIAAVATVNEGQREGLLIQRAVLGLFLAMASVLCMCLSLLFIWAPS